MASEMIVWTRPPQLHRFSRGQGGRFDSRRLHHGRPSPAEP